MKNTETRRKLETMPFDKRFDLVGGEGLCHATGWEVNFEDPAAPDFWQWWLNEYTDSGRLGTLERSHGTRKGNSSVGLGL